MQEQAGATADKAEAAHAFFDQLLDEQRAQDQRQIRLAIRAVVRLVGEEREVIFDEAARRADEPPVTIDQGRGERMRRRGEEILHPLDLPEGLALRHVLGCQAPQAVAAGRRHAAREMESEAVLVRVVETARDITPRAAAETVEKIVEVARQR